MRKKLLIIALALVASCLSVFAGCTDEKQQQIDELQSQIDALQSQIDEYKALLDTSTKIYKVNEPIIISSNGIQLLKVTYTGSKIPVGGNEDRAIFSIENISPMALGGFITVIGIREQDGAVGQSHTSDDIRMGKVEWVTTLGVPYYKYCILTLATVPYAFIEL